MKKLFTGIAIIILFASLLSIIPFALDSQINDLQSMSLIFNSRVYEIEEASGYTYTFNINFTVGSNQNNLSMKAIRISNDGMSFTIEYQSLQNLVWVTVYDNGWSNNDYKYIVVKSGSDCTNQWLCNFINNSVVSASIVHESLSNPYQGYINDINNNNNNAYYLSTIGRYQNYTTAFMALGYCASPATNFVASYLGVPLSVGAIAIAVIVWLKRGAITL